MVKRSTQKGRITCVSSTLTDTSPVGKSTSKYFNIQNKERQYLDNDCGGLIRHQNIDAIVISFYYYTVETRSLHQQKAHNFFFLISKNQVK